MNFKALLFAGVCSICLAEENKISNEFILAIKKVESGGKTGAILGDFDSKTKTYKALGPFQIHFLCWKDAVNFDPKIGGVYTNCLDDFYAQKIVISYLKKYAKIHGFENEKMAKVFNGGPSYLKNSQKNPKTAHNLDIYWLKVKKNLNN